MQVRTPIGREGCKEKLANFQFVRVGIGGFNRESWRWRGEKTLTNLGDLKTEDVIEESFQATKGAQRQDVNWFVEQEREGEDYGSWGKVRENGEQKDGYESTA